MTDTQKKVLKGLIALARGERREADIFDLMYETGLAYPALKAALDELISMGRAEAVDIRTYRLPEGAESGLEAEMKAEGEQAENVPIEPQPSEDDFEGDDEPSEEDDELFDEESRAYREMLERADDDEFGEADEEDDEEIEVEFEDEDDEDEERRSREYRAKRSRELFEALRKLNDSTDGPDEQSPSLAQEYTSKDVDDFLEKWKAEEARRGREEWEEHRRLLEGLTHGGREGAEQAPEEVSEGEPETAGGGPSDELKDYERQRDLLEMAIGLIESEDLQDKLRAELLKFCAKKGSISISSYLNVRPNAEPQLVKRQLSALYEGGPSQKTAGARQL